MSETLLRIADINAALDELQKMYRFYPDDPIGALEAEQREPLVEELNWLQEQLRK